MNIATITPTRGNERFELLQFAKEQMDRQTRQPDNRYFIAFDPENGSCDLTKRVRMGYELAKKDGMDLVIIHEDDDFYNEQYYEIVAAHSYFDFFGYSNSVYYNIRNRTYENIKHGGRSSLFCTAFKVSALEGFTWPPDNTVFLDIAIWNWARRKKKKVKLLSDNPNTGIKGHGYGRSGGKGHTIKLKNQDSEFNFLRSRIDDRAFEFYKSLL